MFYFLQLKNANRPANNVVVIKDRRHMKAKQAVRNDKQSNDKPIGTSTCTTRTKPNLKRTKEFI